MYFLKDKNQLDPIVPREVDFVCVSVVWHRRRELLIAAQKFPFGSGIKNRTVVGYFFFSLALWSHIWSGDSRFRKRRLSGAYCLPLVSAKQWSRFKYSDASGAAVKTEAFSAWLIVSADALHFFALMGENRTRQLAAEMLEFRRFPVGTSLFLTLSRSNFKKNRPTVNAQRGMPPLLLQSRWGF